MKKTTVVLVLGIAFAVTFNFQNAYASFNKGVNNPDIKIIKAVHQDFPGAQEISWAADNGHLIARFNSYNRKITAVYSNRGKLLSTLIYSSTENIPFEMQLRIAKKYPDYVAQCMKEYITNDDHSYYFILKDQKGNQVNWLSIKSNDSGGFIVLQKLHDTV